MPVYPANNVRRADRRREDDEDSLSSSSSGNSSFDNSDEQSFENSVEHAVYNGLEWNKLRKSTRSPSDPVVAGGVGLDGCFGPTKSKSEETRPKLRWSSSEDEKEEEEEGDNASTYTSAVEELGHMDDEEEEHGERMEGMDEAMDLNGNPSGAMDDWMGEGRNGEDDGLEEIVVPTYSLRHGVFHTCEGCTVRITHQSITVTSIVVAPTLFELHFTTSNSSDPRLSRLLSSPSIPPHQPFLWQLPLPVEVAPDSLEVKGKEFTMRKGSELTSSRDSSGGLPGRLSSSTSSIRARDYSRNYGTTDRTSSYVPRSAVSAYRYTPSPSCHVSSTSSSSSSGYSSSLSSSLTRSPSSAPVAYHRSLFTTPPTSQTMMTSAAATLGRTRDREVDRLASSYTSSPMKYSVSTYSTSTLGRESRSDREASNSLLSSSDPTRSSFRTRSSSVTSSFRGPSVRDLNRQAYEREAKEKEREEYRQWEEREREREKERELEPFVKDFRKKVTPGTANEPTTLTVTASGGLGLASPSPSPSRYSSPYTSSFVRSVTSSSIPSLPSSTTAASTLAPSGGPAPPPPPPPPPYESNGYGVKPTAKITPYEERGHVVNPGFTGLRNIGNTCFMNSTLQMLVNCIELKTYFLEQHYRDDVNVHNPLGFKGRLADAFADFMHQMWSCTSRAIEPARIKELVAEKASQFANFAQHDAHEFLSFLLDGLHEDLNRVKTKTLTSTVEADGRPDIEVANESWYNHLLRNNSIFVDLFHGQLKSRLQCPKCDRVSITFDPFVYLAVPFPKQKKSISLHFWPVDPALKPVKLTVQYSADGTVYDLLQAVSDIVGAPAKTLRMVEILGRRIHKVFTTDEKMTHLSSGDVIYVFQVHTPSDCNEEVVEVQAVQRLLFSPSLRYMCSNCGNAKNLSACEGCYNAHYCNRECQENDWAKSHKDECKRSRNTSDNVGQPFIVSLPKSKCTYAHLMRVLEARCRHSVEVFQPPVTSSSDLLSAPTKTRRSSKSPSPSKRKVSPSLDPSTSPSTTEGPASSSSSSSHLTSNGETTRTEKSPKRQTVLPEQHSSTRSSSDMFIVRVIRDHNSFTGTNLHDEGHDAPIVLPPGMSLAICWKNAKDGKPFVNVDSKPHLDLDEERTAKYAAAASAAGGAGGGGDPTLQEMLSMFSETEKLKPEESWYCSKCKDHVEATKRLELYRLPPVLIIQLKRFVYTASITTMHRRSKDERRVVYPIHELNLAPFLADSAPSELPPVYDLTGVVCHSGSSYFGHYISMGRLPGFDAAKTEIDWRNFDDSIVTKLSPSQVQSDDAYLLFYKQRGMATRSIFTRHYSFDPAASGH